MPSEGGKGNVLSGIVIIVGGKEGESGFLEAVVLASVEVFRARTGAGKRGQDCSWL